MYDMKAVIRPGNPFLRSLDTVLSKSTAEPSSCAGGQGFDARWAIELSDLDGRRLSSLYLSESGTCAEIRTTTYKISANLIRFLQAQFPFMNAL